MKDTVHILATVRNPDLLDAALLVFKTLRVGFPKAEVQVWGNALNGEALRAVEGCTRMVGGVFTNLRHTSGEPLAHDGWIESLLLDSFSPFWVLDTDVVCFGAMANPGNGSEGKQGPVMAGRFEPSFQAGNTVHVQRLHTAVMWINPGALRAALRAWMAPFPAPWNRTATFPFVRQYFLPVKDGATRFYDTMAGAWHAVGGQVFTEEEDAKFEHLHCGTWSDLLPAEYGLGSMGQMHRMICRQPELAKGLRRNQARYYEAHAVGKGEL